MILKKFQDKQLSALGMGCMRLPVIDGDDSRIDIEKTQEMFDLAISNGINYFDTAWGYHSGQSEKIVGQVLKKYPRESFYLASKFPGYDAKNMERIEEIFEEQLRKCQVEYFDFYLMHTLSESNVEYYLDDEKYGLMSYLLKQKELGRIKHIGFSVHCNFDTFERFLNAYGKYMEFCQVQLNYLDWTLQDAKSKVELLEKYNIPVWVMEPVRGGKLANLEEKYEKLLLKQRPQEKAVAWAFRFLQTIPSVTMVLSGMSNYQQTADNIETYKTEKPLNEDEWKLIMSIADNMINSKTMTCTSCRYCTTYCPKELDIPLIIELYNKLSFENEGSSASDIISSLAEDKRPSECIECKACEKVCPQKIRISSMMSDFSSKINEV